MNITIQGNPITKKNSSQIIPCKGRHILIPSKQYKEYEKKCATQLPNLEKPIDYPVNVKCVYFMPTKRKVDLTNLIAATNDILVHYGILADDNCTIVVSHDGSRVVLGDKEPRVEVTIESL